MWEKKKVPLLLHAETFKKMNNLRMIHFTSNIQEGDIHLESLPDGLKLLRWDSFPQISLSLDFCSKNLVTLDMRYSNLEQLWEGNQVFHFKLYLVCPLYFGDTIIILKY
jgi:hypothetical protein